GPRAADRGRALRARRPDRGVRRRDPRRRAVRADGAPGRRLRGRYGAGQGAYLWPAGRHRRRASVGVPRKGELIAMRVRRIASITAATLMLLGIPGGLTARGAEPGLYGYGMGATATAISFLYNQPSFGVPTDPT